MVAAGAGGAPRLARRRQLLGRRAPASTTARSASSWSIPATSGATGRSPRLSTAPASRSAGRSSSAGRSRRGACSRTATSPPSASRTPASCSTGRAWAPRASAFGRTRAQARRAPERSCRPSSLGSATAWRQAAASITATRLVVTAFQRHFRPARVDGVPDRETLARLDGLLASVGKLRLKPSRAARHRTRGSGGRMAAPGATRGRKVRAPRKHGAG